MEQDYIYQSLRLYWQEVRRHKKIFIPLIVLMPTAMFFNNYASAWIIAQVINRLTIGSVPQSALWSTIANLDRIIVLEEGRIREQGTHKQLLKTRGIYATLWEHQSGGFIEE